MESENKFIERVDEVIADFSKEVKTAKERKAVIVIASEPVNDGKAVKQELHWGMNLNWYMLLQDL